MPVPRRSGNSQRNLKQNGHAPCCATMQRQNGFVTPALWHSAVANLVNKAVGTQRLTEEDGDRACQALQALDIALVPLPTPAAAYRLARTYRRSVSASFSFAAAQSQQIDFWTGDRRLYNAVSPSLPFVKGIGDSTSPEHS